MVHAGGQSLPEMKGQQQANAVGDQGGNVGASAASEADQS